MATMMFAGVASAGTVRVNGEVIDHFKTVIDREPYKVEVCEKVSNKTQPPKRESKESDLEKQWLTI